MFIAAKPVLHECFYRYISLQTRKGRVINDNIENHNKSSNCQIKIGQPDNVYYKIKYLTHIYIYLMDRILNGILCNYINNNLKKTVKSLSNVYLLSVYMSSSLTLNLRQNVTDNIKKRFVWCFDEYICLTEFIVDLKDLFVIVKTIFYIFKIM